MSLSIFGLCNTMQSFVNKQLRAVTASVPLYDVSRNFFQFHFTWQSIGPVAKCNQIKTSRIIR